ncbi:MAG: ATP-binding protein [Xanthobacteraceae bacterium]
MTASGIDRALKFRHLFILRSIDPPRGTKTTQLVDKFRQASGQFIALTDDDLRAFVALRAMAARRLDGFDAWLRARRPLFDTPLFKAAGLAPPAFLPLTPHLDGGPASGPPRPDDGPPPGIKMQAPLTSAPSSDTAIQARDASKPRNEHVAPPPAAQTQAPLPRPERNVREIPIGRRCERGTLGAAVTLSAELLRRHVAILAGSGSGKTVLLRRIVEEAALLGIPAIVLDTNNDLARLGDPWPAAPEGWTVEDTAKAADYRHNVEVAIWTPGRNSGRPMSLALLPDFAALRQDADEREQAIEMARATLAPYLGTGGATAKLREGVLADTLRSFAHAGGGGLDQLIDMLSDLPDDVSTIDDAPKLASAIANQLRAAIATNPLLQSRGSTLDPAVLFQAAAGKTRISVLNLSGLGSDEARQSFVNQLQMSLFTWIKRNPSPTGRLYVVDEAQNFAPSQKLTPCKESTLSLAAQARKYGLGMIFATQTPKGIDNKIISNCTTQFYGRMSAPATIEATRELMAAKGGSGDDIGRLTRGEFYFSTEAVQRPIRIRTPLCLTWHPANPLTIEEVIAKARTTA